MLVLGADGVQFVQEGLVGDRPRPQALLVQHGQDAILMLEKLYSLLLCVFVASKMLLKSAAKVTLHHTKPVRGGETGRVTHILNEVADNGVVEIFNVGPFDAL